MTWNNNGGPWGPSHGKSGDKQGASKPGANPWMQSGRPKGPSSGGNGGGGGSQDIPPPPDFNKLFEEMDKKFRQWFGRSGGSSRLVILGVAAFMALWALSGFYQVGTEQVGVVMRFGAFERTEKPGLHYHLPSPIEDVLLPNVTSQNAIQIGFRSPLSTRMAARDVDSRSLPEESMMLTQDENIINVEFSVFWRISDIQKFLFEIRDPEMTIKMAAESAMREVIGQNKLQFALTDGRGQIAEESRLRLQKLMDDYNAGVMITQINLQTVSVPDEVKAAFQDVVNARLDQERFRNEAETHANKVVPEAKGEAAKIEQQAVGYRDQKIALAKGEADRFREVLTAYNAARDVTSKRLYLETMEAVLANARKVVLDKSGASAVPYLMPLRESGGGAAARPSPAQAAVSSDEGASR
ncbi:MAG: FtsH protease activity modulator HflK [Bdellovibrionales bacterium]